LRILYVAGARNLDNPGGIETYGRELIKGISGRGHVVEYFETAAEVVAADRRIRDYWPAPAFRQRYYLRRRFPHEDLRFHMALRRRALRTRAAFRPDITHALHVYPLGAIVGAREPVIVSAYGLEVECIPPVVGSLSLAGTVHAISGFTANLVRTRIPQPPPIEVLGWGIRQPVERARASDFDLITVARLVRRKNVDTILRALQAAGDVRYAVVGDGPELGALKDLARSLGLTRVSFFGAVTEQRRRELLSRSRVFVMCPRQEGGDVEGLGLVYFEAFEHGLPVVASSSGGVPDAVGDAGLLVDDPEDVGQIAEAIVEALDECRYADLTARVRARQQSHSWDRFLDDFEALYERMAARA
jgi:phosphatidyl-myo-inositol dimannoside synthase